MTMIQDKTIAQPGDLDNKIVLLCAVSVFIHAYLCGAVALLGAAYALVNRQKRDAVASVAHLRCLLAFGVLALAVPPLCGNWLGLAVGAAILVTLVFYLYARTVMSAGLFDAVADTACIISLVYFLIAVMQRVFGHASRSPSTFQNANYYGFALELVLLLAVYRHSTAKSKAHRALCVIVCLANLAALCMAGSRSAWPALLSGLFVYFLMLGNRKALIALFACCAAGLAMLLAFPDLTPRMESIGAARIIRLGIWQETLEGIRRHPVFGVGAMGYLHLSGIRKFYHSHNLLLETLISFGAAGTACIGMYFILTLRDCWRRFRERGRHGVYPLVFAAVAVTAVHGLTDVTVLWPQTGILLVLILSVQGVTKTMNVSYEITKRGLSGPDVSC